MLDSSGKCGISPPFRCNLSPSYWRCQGVITECRAKVQPGSNPMLRAKMTRQHVSCTAGLLFHSTYGTQWMWKKATNWVLHILCEIGFKVMLRMCSHQIRCCDENVQHSFLVGVSGCWRSQQWLLLQTCPTAEVERSSTFWLLQSASLHSC